MKTIEAKSTTPPPCRYTADEVVQRVLQATADVDAGRNLISLAEFENVWHHLSLRRQCLFDTDGIGLSRKP